MGSFVDILSDHPALQNRISYSEERLDDVRTRLLQCPRLTSEPVTVFCAGSFARGEAGSESDLDLFLSTEDENTANSRLCAFELFAELIRVNEEAGFPQFSNDGQYLCVYHMKDLEEQTGSPEDDGENYFTARMLMLLEAQPLLDSTAFREHQDRLVQHYFRDGKGKKEFKPLFLLNDVLRYWRTLCLNYEQTRHDSTRHWRKKNVNLKFSRMVTVFATVLPLVSFDTEDLGVGSPLWKKTPLERLGLALEEIPAPDMLQRWGSFLEAYEGFLQWKEDPDIDARLAELKDEIATRAVEVSEFLYDALHHDSIPVEYQRYLVL